MKLMNKRRIAIILSMLMMISAASGPGNCFTREVKAVTLDEINNSEVFLKQVNGDKQCTLVAATMLIRRAAMMSGNTGWADITADKVMEQAWIEGQGLKHSFTYAGITVDRAVFGADPAGEAITLLEMHPEGIVLYDQIRSPRSHAVLLTDYTDGIFYSADPSDAVPIGRIPNDLSLVRVADAEFYWYVSGPAIAPASPSGTDGNNPSVIDINTLSVTLSQTSFPYDGTEKKPAVTIPGLQENTDYAVSYLDNVEPGPASVIITGVGTYSGIITMGFVITDASAGDILNEIRMTLSKQTIKKGKTAKVEVTLPASLVVVKEYSGDPLRKYNEVRISYVSDNKKVASVNSTGKITGKKKGTAKIYAIAEFADGARRIDTLQIKVK